MESAQQSSEHHCSDTDSSSILNASFEALAFETQYVAACLLERCSPKMVEEYMHRLSVMLEAWNAPPSASVPLSQQTVNQMDTSREVDHSVADSPTSGGSVLNLQEMSSSVVQDSTTRSEQVASEQDVLNLSWNGQAVISPSPKQKRGRTYGGRGRPRKRMRTYDGRSLEALSLVSMRRGFAGEPSGSGIIDPLTLKRKLIQAGVRADEQRFDLMIKFFYGVASPNAFCELREAYHRGRQTMGTLQSSTSNDIHTTVRLLDNLSSGAVLQRRYHLATLVAHRNRLQSQFLAAGRGEKLHSGRKARTACPGKQTAAGQALQALIFEAYPALQERGTDHHISVEYDRKYNSMKTRLSSGRNWHILSSTFPVGILAVIESGCHEVKIAHNKIISIENMQQESFSIIVNFLEEYRGEFLHRSGNLLTGHISSMIKGQASSTRYALEDVDEEQLRNAVYDSEFLVRMCDSRESHIAEMTGTEQDMMDEGSPSATYLSPVTSNDLSRMYC